MRSDLELE